MPSSTILSDNGVSSGTSGIKTSGGNDGLLLLQTTTAGGTATTAVTIGTDQSVTFAQGANLPNTFGFKNRIINGAMMIDQRNAGASVTPTSGQFLVDRFYATLTQASKFTAQQNAGAVTPPAGFIKYLGCTSSSAYSVAAGDVFTVSQQIEGLNVADLGWGTANAQSVTLSFWVRSSLTGTFAGNIQNYAQTYSYVFTYSISSANTWTYVTITVPGQTAGVWATDNTSWAYVRFNLGVGSTYQTATTNAWVSGNYWSTSSATSVVGTNGATFYITGVQLEKGSTATSFDFRSYGTEVALCQRYYNKSYSIDVTPGTNTSAGSWRSVSAGGAGWVNFDFPVEMRVAPTVTPYSNAGTSGVYGSDAGNWTPNATYISTRRHSANGLVTSGNYVYGQYVASSEL